MTCPLYDFCKYARNDFGCSKSHPSCKQYRTLEIWINGIIDSAIENALEDLK